MDLKIKMRPNHKIGTMNELFSLINRKKHVLHNKIGQTIKKSIKNIYFKMEMAAILDFWAVKKLAHTFGRGMGGSNPHLAFLDHKSTEKPTYALNGHGSAINDPTILTAKFCSHRTLITFLMAAFIE